MLCSFSFGSLRVNFIPPLTINCQSSRSYTITNIWKLGISKIKLQFFFVCFKLMTQSQYAVALGKMVQIGSVQKSLGDTRGFLGARTIQFYFRLTRKQILREMCWGSAKLPNRLVYNGDFGVHPLRFNFRRFGVGLGICILTITPSESDAGRLHYWRDISWVRKKISTLAIHISVLCACKNFKTPYKQDSIANKEIEEQCG